MKMKKQNKNQRRARVDRAVDRNEFIRLGQSVKNEASGASGAPEGKKKFKKIQKDYVPVVLPEAGLDSSAEKPKSKKKYRSVRASPSLLNAGSAALDGSGEFNDAEGNRGGENVIEVQGWVSGPDDAEPLDAEGDLTFAEPASLSDSCCGYTVYCRLSPRPQGAASPATLMTRDLALLGL